VLDEVGCERAAILSWTAPPGLLFAATHPERTTALVLVNPVLRLRSRSADDDPPGVLGEREERFFETLRAEWGTGVIAGGFVQSRVGDERFLRWCGRCERLAMEPGEVYWRLRSVFDVDLRHAFPAVRVPTLVICGSDPGRRPHARYIAEHVDGARMVEVGAQDLMTLGSESGAVLDAVEEFLAGGLPTHSVDRMLATVMFTDVVRSTESLARTGDRRWRELLASHDTLIRAELARFDGREVKSTGDGILATFDGPGRAVRCATAIRDQLQSLRIEVRVGLHTGEIERHGDDIAGIAVHIAQRVQGLAQPGEVLVSRTVVDLVAGSGLPFTDRGSHALKGVPGDWSLFATAP
jgi:class 3 adenylate cyclase